MSEFGGNVALPFVHPNYTGIQVRPDWVIVGTKWDQGQVAVFASRSLAAAQLSYSADYDDLHIGGVFWKPVMTSQEWRLEVILGRGADGTAFVIIKADTYAECMRRLMEMWSPDEDEPPMLREVESDQAATSGEEEAARKGLDHTP